MSRTVVVDCFPEAAARYAVDHTVVAVDVIRATTTVATGVVTGRRCLPVPSIEAAVPAAAALDRPLLVGELGGSLPYGFDLTNSPADLADRTDVERPMILLSTSGTRLLHESRHADVCYAASLRNWRAQATRLVQRHPRVAVIGAGTRGEFREEDQLCCAWIAAALMHEGYAAEDDATVEVVERWQDATAEAITRSASARYLQATGQQHDLDFILAHVDDLDQVFVFDGFEVRAETP